MPEGDDRPRYVCHSCGAIHYQNPKVVTGCIAEWEDKVLLCKRAIEPRYGFWTLPAGFMENRETTHEGAAREALEEANARVKIHELYTLFDLPQISQVYMLFRGRLLDLNISGGDESLEVRLFGEDEIPWNDIAFSAVHETLKFYFQDRASGEFKMRVGTIERISRQPRRYRTLIL